MRFEAHVDDLASDDVRSLVLEHVRSMHIHSPPESVYAFSIDALRRPDITFWSIWDGSALCGCAALRELSALAGEVKSMRTCASHLRQGVGQFALDVIVRTAHERGYHQLLLETGTGPAFEAAHGLYLKNGFSWCGKFGDYKATDFNVFMAKSLKGDHRVA